jgi:hypothetical protein
VSTCALSPYHDTQVSPCPEYNRLPNWLRAYFDAAGVSCDAPHAQVAYLLFAVVDFTRLLDAFERAGQSAQRALGAAYSLGGLPAARQFVASLALPGVKVDKWGTVVWDPSGATDVRHEGAA